MTAVREGSRSLSFRREREASWRELETLAARVESSGLDSLSAAELIRLPVLYRATLSSLSVARAISLDRNLLDYLESLSSRAYFLVYCRKRSLRETLAAFFHYRFPQAVHRVRKSVIVASAALFLGLLAGFLLVAEEPTSFFNFVSPELANGRTPSASTDALRAVLYTTEDSTATFTHFATFLFTHNARIGLLCVALGCFAGVPVILLLFSNGTTIGAMLALYVSKGLGLEFVAWLLPHGITELLAVVLCGAAGLSIGYGLVFPGPFRRLDNLALRGRHAARIATGSVAMFFFAALIEGVFRQVIIQIDIRVLVIVVTSVGWAFYFVRGARRKPGMASEADLDAVFGHTTEPERP